MGAKIKPQTIPGPKFNSQKNPMTNFRAIKISRGTMQPGYTRLLSQLNLLIVLNTPKNRYLNQATPKNTLQNFPSQKNREIKNFKPKKIL